MNEGIAAVTFDVGGTLIRPHPSVGTIYATVAERCGCGRIDPAALDRNFAQAWKSKERFAYDAAGWKQLVTQTFASFPAVEIVPDLFEAIYDAFRDPTVWHVFADVRPVLKRLRDAGLKLGVISNWDERLHPLLDRLSLTESFEAMIVSHEVGATKPAETVFRRAAKILQVAPESILHIGDSQWEDCDGARAVGMQALLLEREGKVDRPGVIHSLNEIGRPLSSP